MSTRRRYPSPVLIPSERRQWVDRLQDDLAVAFGASERKRAVQFLKVFEAEIKFRLLRAPAQEPR